MSGLIQKFEDLREQAKNVMEDLVFNYIDGGADDEITLVESRQQWRD